MNNINQLIEKISTKCQEKGLKEFEIGYNSLKSNSTKLYEQKIDSYSDNQGQSISLKVKLNNQIGRSFIEDLQDTNIDFLVEEAINNAKIIESNEEEFFHDGSGEYKKAIKYKPLDKIKTLDKVEYLKNLENLAYKQDSRVEKVISCSINESYNNIIITNSLGLNLAEEFVSANATLYVLANDGVNKKSNYEYHCFDKEEDFDPKNLVTKTVEKVIKKLNPIDVKPNGNTVLLNNDTTSDLISRIVSLFSAYKVQKNRTKLAGKLNQKIAVDCFTLIDDPFIENGYGSSSFDSEGVPSQYKELITDGVLKTYLYNLKSANVDRVKSTGNGAGGSSVNIFNLYVKPGNKSQKDLLKQLDNGIFIDDIISGQGFDAISGDFSLEVEGFNVENGKITNSLNTFIISGNIFNLLFNIREIANDLDFKGGTIAAPSMLVDGISISNN